MKIEDINVASNPKVADHTAPAIFVNTTTKQDLLRRAKAAIGAGERSLQEAAEALGLAQQEHAATNEKWPTLSAGQLRGSTPC